MEISQMSVTSPQLKQKLFQKSRGPRLIKETLLMISMENETNSKGLNFLVT